MKHKQKKGGKRTAFGFLLIAGYLVFSLVISAINARAAGNIWFETKAINDGWSRLLAYAAAVMSACGFTWVYMIFLGLIAMTFGQLDSAHFEALLSLGYLAIVIPAIGSGLAITVNSLYVARKTRKLANTGIAGWNVFAQAYNMYNAISLVPKSVENVINVFGSDDSEEDSAQAQLVLAIAIIAILGGILTTLAIVRLTARAHAAELKSQIYSDKRAVATRY